MFLTGPIRVGIRLTLRAGKMTNAGSYDGSLKESYKEV